MFGCARKQGSMQRLLGTYLGEGSDMKGLHPVQILDNMSIKECNDGKEMNMLVFIL